MNPIQKRWRLALASAAAAAFLASCGGGSEESSAPLASAAPAAASQRPATAAAATTTAAPMAAARASRSATSIYIVRMSGKPAVAYEGGVQGLARTKADEGQKFNANRTEVRNYVRYLKSRHDETASKSGVSRKIYSYGYTVNGFAAEMTEAQVAKMALAKGVLSITKNEIRPLDTASTPSFLGLTGPNGVWAKAGGTGEGVVIGMVDSGITPSSLSFTDRVTRDGKPSRTGPHAYQPLAFDGACETGEGFHASDCNRKLISARYFNKGMGGDEGVKESWPYEFNSPKDWGGHGTHTASTAGGNSNVKITGHASAMGSISGMAPRARIAVYKVCWSVTEDGGGCATIDSMAAIDQAVEDGVDVINYSISGSTTRYDDPVEEAFMWAAYAGVFVAASAGNSGPTASTVAHPSPWLTTVAAGTHNRDMVGSALANGVTYNGSSAAERAVTNKPFISASAAALPGVSPDAARLCFTADDNGGSPALDPAKVGGKIVLCDRGSNARVNKSAAVLMAGGAGMVMVNTSANSVNADIHALPSIHLAHTASAALHAYAATPGAKATINKSSGIVLTVPAPLTASFSSRGPSRAMDGMLLKPDIMAPGQDIMASVAPPGNHELSFDLYSGTSMSSPHIAGLAAIMKQLHPDWSPMSIKSAMMTTAGDALDGPSTSADQLFRVGAGHVKPSAMSDPGLVYKSTIGSWLSFLCATQWPGGLCDYYGVPTPYIDPANFNTPSISIGGLPGAQTVTRKVTNVGTKTATYKVSTTGMTGINVQVEPATLTLAPNASATFSVTFTNMTAPLNTYQGGQLTWTESNGPHKVRIPMVVKPVALGAPGEVTGSYSVKFGFTGTLTTTVEGLVPAATLASSVTQSGHTDLQVVVPSGTTMVRFSTFDGSPLASGTDLDMEVYRGNPDSGGVFVGGSGGSTTAETVTLTNPTAATYYVRIVGYDTKGANPANFTLYSWQLDGTTAGNLTASASSAVLGATGIVTLTPSGLSAGTKYMGRVIYGGASGLPAPTIVRIDQPNSCGAPAKSAIADSACLSLSAAGKPQ